MKMNHALHMNKISRERPKSAAPQNTLQGGAIDIEKLFLGMK